MSDKQRWVVTGSKVQAEMYTQEYTEVENGDVVTIQLSAPGKQTQTWLMRVDRVVGKTAYLEAVDIIRVQKKERDQ